MPIHFSIGFVIESSPKRPYVAVCAGVVGDVQVRGVCDMVSRINACVEGDKNISVAWPREESCK